MQSGVAIFISSYSVRDIHHDPVIEPGRRFGPGLNLSDGLGAGH